jgi:hypothetical protein
MSTLPTRSSRAARRSALVLLAALPALRVLALAQTPLAGDVAIVPGAATVTDSTAASSPGADVKTVDAFRALCRSKAATALKNYSISVAGRSGWLFFSSELRHVGAGKFWGQDAARVSQSAFAAHADPLPAILDFKQQLDRAGVELLLVPVPPKSVVYPDMLWNKAPLASWPAAAIGHSASRVLRIAARQRRASTRPDRPNSCAPLRCPGHDLLQAGHTLVGSRRLFWPPAA